MGHLLMENRSGLVVATPLTQATGLAEREAASRRRPPKTWAREARSDLLWRVAGEDQDGRPACFFDVEERLAGLSRKGDDLERLQAVVDFELFRPELERASAAGGPQQGRAPAVRSRPDVQGPDPADPEQPE